MPEDVKTNRPLADRREIRVFISSTFRDMQEEREELVKQIFPQLRRLCESRGVTWGEVDLRWGVPDEAKAEGKVLPLCLQEIEHCRPYFIGLLGERYGWVPEEIPESLFETQPWLREHLHQSVTALEILHGVLLDPEMEKHAFFYFRDPAYAATHPCFTEEDPRLRERLAKLKDDIRQSGFPVSEPFATPKQLGEWVLRDLTAVIGELYPEKDIPNALDRAALDHEAYSASRRTVYIGRQEYMDRLDAHAEGDGLPLVIVGESGGGKSALMANWTHTWSEQHPETPVLVHFIGAAPDSANWMAMLRRLLGEFQRKFGIQIEIPDQSDALSMAFANALHMVAAHGRVVLVLDALDQIEDRDGAPDLVWLPPVIPANVRLVVSTLPGRPWNDMKKRGWPVMTVEPLTTPEREELIFKYLKRYSKQLSPGPAHRIAAAPQTGNGLYLSALLNELRLFGRHEDLDRRIDWYLEAADPFELYGKVIGRWEQDFEEEGIGAEDLVGNSLTRVWAARRGISETELLESMGTEDSPLPRAFWTPLYLAAGDALVNRGGLLTFAHGYLREAVRNAYLPTESHQHQAHRALAEYFDRQKNLLEAQMRLFESQNNESFHDFFSAWQLGRSRVLYELPWQLQEATEWQKLANLLADEEVLDWLLGEDEFEVRAYWARVEANSDLRMEDVYAVEIREAKSEPYRAAIIAELLSGTGRIDAASALNADIVDGLRGEGDPESLKLARIREASSLHACGDLDGAMALYKEQERVCRESDDRDGLHQSLSGQASILLARRDLDGAMALYKEQERVCREMGYEYGFASSMMGLADSLCGQSRILCARGDLDGAMSLSLEAERISREQDRKDGVLTSLADQGGILHLRGELDRAMVLFKDAEAICREIGDKDELPNILIRQAFILQARGDLDGAVALHKEAELLCRELGKNDALLISRVCEALILSARGDLDGARALFDECELLSQEPGTDWSLSTLTGHLADLLGMISGRGLETNQLAEKILELLSHPSFQQRFPGSERMRDALDECLSTYSAPTNRLQFEGGVSAPHPMADGARAARLNLEYQWALKKWEALPWLNRMRTPKPTPPSGI